MAYGPTCRGESAGRASRDCMPVRRSADFIHPGLQRSALHPGSTVAPLGPPTFSPDSGSAHPDLHRPEFDVPILRTSMRTYEKRYIACARGASSALSLVPDRCLTGRGYAGCPSCQALGEAVKPPCFRPDRGPSRPTQGRSPPWRRPSTNRTASRKSSGSPAPSCDWETRRTNTSTTLPVSWSRRSRTALLSR